MSVPIEDPVEFVFVRYGSAEYFRRACKRRGVHAKRRLDTVLVGRADVDRVWQLARSYRVRAIDGDPAP